MSVGNEQGRLFASFHGLASPLEHLFYDVFETKDEVFGIFRFSFFADENGAIAGVAVPFEPAGGKIMFNRIPNKK